jgi:hypothetical protein
MLVSLALSKIQNVDTGGDELIKINHNLPNKYLAFVATFHLIFVK